MCILGSVGHANPSRRAGPVARSARWRPVAWAATRMSVLPSNTEPNRSTPGPAPGPEETAPAQVRTAAAEKLEAIERHSRELEGASAEEILTWAVETYFPRFTMATGLGPEGCVVISMLAKIEPRVYVFNLDTGYQFHETLELREQIQQKYGITIALEKPDQSVEEYERLHGGPVYRVHPDRCCHDRKIRVLRRVASGFDAWATGVRRSQSPTRADTPIVKWDKKFGMVKISPLATWSKSDVWKRILDEQIPYNPLHDQGYPSIGCWPCTRPVAPGEDERAGRWSGTAKTECGLHTAGD
jgi:phosphoadenosine phosphosulfate reductase